MVTTGGVFYFRGVLRFWAYKLQQGGGKFLRRTGLQVTSCVMSKHPSRPGPARPDPTRPGPTRQARPGPTRPDPARPDPGPTWPARPGPSGPDPSRIPDFYFPVYKLQQGGYFSPEHKVASYNRGGYFSGPSCNQCYNSLIGWLPLPEAID